MLTSILRLTPAVLLIAAFAFAQPAFGQEAETGDHSGEAQGIEWGPPPDYDLNHLCWVEFRCDDNGAAAEFYGSVFGWKFTNFGDDMPTYTFFEPPSGLMGGFNGGMQDGAPDLSIYIYVDDVDGALAEVEAAGAVVALPKTPVGDSGNIAFFVDPAGVIMGLADMYMPVEDTPYPFGEGDKPKPNTLCFFEVFAGENMTASTDFYGGVFGWKTAAVEGHDEKVVFSPGAGAQGVFLKETDGINVLAYIWVDDVSAALEKVVEAGGEVLYGGPITAPHVAVFGYFKDPSGVVVGLLGEK